ncbi:MAG: UDP-N-acetylglucosamine--N-acetylmuramyl-(pentapeptide) pyrophosphoryl-undecaprenol N-acetylglucosamine transferase [Deltaproteobacteria bacterium]|nr:UDP-N-acetylglucosamine--N-acetylmuramyl-(pentapeptide) pyrophosphoryl-undecaprenol N-acetylglucosamine transferase [Deltaproteobacteria bacterium]
MYPAVAIAEALRRRWPGVRLVFAGIRGRAEEKIVPALGYELRFVPATGMPPLHDVVGMARFAWTLGAGVRAAGRILDEFVPDAVIGTGGYASAPVLLAAVGAVFPRSREKRPATLVHEQNAVPGKLNRLVGRRVDRVAATFPESLRFFPSSRAFHSGYPLRAQIGGIDRSDARRKLDLPRDAFVLLAFGGSLGARTINRGVAAALPALLAEPGVFVLHGTGRYSGADYDPQDDTARAVARHALSPERLSRYRPADFLDPIGVAYAAADVVICRAGAGTLSEVQACGLPAIIVPKKGLPGDHQTANAKSLETSGAAKVVPERDEDDPTLGRIAAIDPQALARTVLDLRRDEAARSAMGATIRGLHVPGAAERIVEEIEGLLGGVRP